MNETKKTLAIVVEPVVFVECFCPYCDGEKKIIWDTDLSEMTVYCTHCAKGYIVEREDK